MSDSLAVLTRSKVPWVVQLVLAAVLAVAAAVLWVKYPEIGLPKEFEQYVPLFCGSFLLLCAFAVVLSVVFILDQTPKLAIDEHGIEDFRHRNGPCRIAWEDVQSLDYEITKVNGAVSQARVNVYVIETGGTVEEVTINVHGLNRSPLAVIGIIKKRWIQFNYDRDRTVP